MYVQKKSCSLTSSGGGTSAGGDGEDFDREAALEAGERELIVVDVETAICKNKNCMPGRENECRDSSLRLRLIDRQTYQKRSTNRSTGELATTDIRNTKVPSLGKGFARAPIFYDSCRRGF